MAIVRAEAMAITIESVEMIGIPVRTLFTSVITRETTCTSAVTSDTKPVMLRSEPPLEPVMSEEERRGAAREHAGNRARECPATGEAGDGEVECRGDGHCEAGLLQRALRERSGAGYGRAREHVAQVGCLTCDDGLPRGVRLAIPAVPATCAATPYAWRAVPAA